MDDLLKKLNVLVKATLNDALTGDSRRSKLVSPNTDTPSAVQEGNQQITQLRQRINETLAFEDELQKQIQALQAEVTDWDSQADTAVNDGDDAKARYAVEQMQRAQERLAMAKSDLAEHERVTQELIYHVNTLEAAVDAAKQKQTDDASSTGGADKVSGVLRECGIRLWSYATNWLRVESQVKRQRKPPLKLLIMIWKSDENVWRNRSEC